MHGIKIKIKKVIKSIYFVGFPSLSGRDAEATIHGVGLLPCFFQAKPIILLALFCDRIDFSCHSLATKWEPLKSFVFCSHVGIHI
jgi:hypothetical protein